MSVSAQDGMIETLPRIVVCVIGVLLLCGAGVLLYFPPAEPLMPLGGNATAEAANSPARDYRLLAGSLAPLAVLLILVGANGSRLVQANLKDGSFTAADPLLAFRVWQNQGAQSQDVPLDDGTGEPEAAAATAADIRVARTTDGSALLYSINTVPAAIIADVIHNLPDGVNAPLLSDFEFASKPSGKGNHSWTVKFAGRPAYRLSYGGQGKTDPTVAEA